MNFLKIFSGGMLMMSLLKAIIELLNWKEEIHMGNCERDFDKLADAIDVVIKFIERVGK